MTKKPAKKARLAPKPAKTAAKTRAGTDRTCAGESRTGAEKAVSDDKKQFPIPHSEFPIYDEPVMCCKGVYFITGIDTGIGKSVATGLVARHLMRQGVKVVTQKMVQTGVSGTISEDILLHRQLMGIEPFAQDLDGTTCPFVFRLPASPHLAARQENRVIDPSQITSATKRLLETFDVVLLEGAGGLHVPLTRDDLIADTLETRNDPLIVVTSGRLGSINHTLLTLEAAAHRRIPLAGLIFNHHLPTNKSTDNPTDELIRLDSLDFFRRRLKHYGRDGSLVEMPTVDDFQNPPDIDFSPLFEGL